MNAERKAKIDRFDAECDALDEECMKCFSGSPSEIHCHNCDVERRRYQLWDEYGDKLDDCIDWSEVAKNLLCALIAFAGFAGVCYAAAAWALGIGPH